MPPPKSNIFSQAGPKIWSRVCMLPKSRPWLSMFDDIFPCECARATLLTYTLLMGYGLVLARPDGRARPLVSELRHGASCLDPDFRRL